MKFSEYPYERPSYEEVKKSFDKFLHLIQQASSKEEQLKNIRILNEVRNTVETMGTLASIRHSIDTTDEFYDKEKDYWDEYSPLYEELNTKFYEVLVNSPFRNELEEDLSKQFFQLAEFALQVFKPEIIEDLQLENKYSSQYTKLLASAKIMFEGEERNISGLSPFMLSKDREIRQKANDAKYGFFLEHQKEIDTIYDNLVKVRHSIAKKLGFSNFVEVGYIRMKRTDYNPSMVESFRKQVLEYIVPVATKLYESQKVRLGVDTLTYFDEKFEFLNGNATPKGSSDWILENGVKMYSELSPETKEFFDFMVTNDLLDLVTKKGKAGGGYCTYIPDYKAPFIFSNFNGTAGDIDVLTHEAGHAFQTYQSRWIDIPELNFPTYESCEIHSMSMEFFTWPWMNLFFGDEEQKYKYSHLGSAIKFIPYGIVVDAYQHFVYENPTATPKERNAYWRELEKQYLPHKNYEGSPLLEEGGWWYQQGHIFNSPFYYIDYTLAQICALQYWKWMHDDHDAAWNSYLELCSVGGTKSFLGLIEVAKLKSPFEEGCVQSIIGDIDAYLSNVKDQEL